MAAGEVMGMYQKQLYYVSKLSSSSSSKNSRAFQTAQKTSTTAISARMLTGGRAGRKCRRLERRRTLARPTHSAVGRLVSSHRENHTTQKRHMETKTKNKQTKGSIDFHVMQACRAKICTGTGPTIAHIPVVDMIQSATEAIKKFG